jgi:hypothetical protein
VTAPWDELAKFFTAVRETMKNGRFDAGAMPPAKLAAIEVRAQQWRLQHMFHITPLMNFMGENCGPQPATPTKCQAL